MSIARRKTRMAANRSSVPELHSGDRLTRAEFHRRYEASPEDFKAELIGGVVYVASPARRPHGTIHFNLSLVLSYYMTMTPGLEGGDNLTTILEGDREPQPDLLLRIRTEFGGQSHYNDDDYLVGGPEFVAEIAHSSVAIDLGKKRDDYFQSGVQEYLVACIDEQEVQWFHFPSRKKLKSDKDGILRSKVFPGLWLDARALFAEDAPRLLKVIQQGVASPEHAAFVQKLARRK